MLRKWYNLSNEEFADGEIDPSSEILLQSDSDDACNNVLLQTDSEDENRVVIASDVESDGCDDVQGLLQESSTEEPVEQPPAKKRRYQSRTQTMNLKFLQKPVCKQAHMRLYGIGSSALQNVRSGRQAFIKGDSRLKEPKHPSLGVSLGRSSINTKWPSILSFFWLLYISVAEIMPTKFVIAGAYTESFIEKDPDFQERYTRAFMTTIEKHFDLSPVAWV